MIVFIMMILCLAGVIKAFIDVEIIHDGDFHSVFEDDYYQSRAYIQESEKSIGALTRLIGEYKNEEHILKGGTISADELRSIEENLYLDYQDSINYNPDLSKEENVRNFKKVYAKEISREKDKMIKEDLRDFYALLQYLEEQENRLYYASDGTNVFTNSTTTEKDQFKTYPSYMIFENYKSEIYPKETKENDYLYWITEREDELNSESNVVHIAFTEKYLDQKIKEWKENKVVATKNLYKIVGFLAGFILSFLYLVLVIGRKSFKDQELNFNLVDKLYNDLNISLCIGIIVVWVLMLEAVNAENIHNMVIPITIPISTIVFMLVFSLVKHLKNRTFIKHTWIYRILNKIVKFVRDVYNSGSVGVKTVLLVVGYPILVALTFFIFPITLGLAAWFVLKKVKSYNRIKEGVERIMDGDLQHRIDVSGNGEFAKLAANINSITDGLNKAVDSELKSERLKTELITNVSHDLRTPLTSIITYVDLLKNEKDSTKVEKYIEVLDQKSKRLKILTDDLMDAAKATSGNIPVHFAQIDIVSLINQGLGEVNDKIEASDLEFKINHPEDRVYLKADGKLLWRSIENLLSNIFKYALKGSRVYIDIEDMDNEIRITFKNISAFELNISADELMERFKRGDESRSSQGSGLGLSIAKSLIEVQNGKFDIQIDGDLFKVMIYMPKDKIVIFE